MSRFGYVHAESEGESFTCRVYRSIVDKRVIPYLLLILISYYNNSICCDDRGTMRNEEENKRNRCGNNKRISWIPLRSSWFHELEHFRKESWYSESCVLDVLFFHSLFIHWSHLEWATHRSLRSIPIEIISSFSQLYFSETIFNILASHDFLYFSCALTSTRSAYIFLLCTSQNSNLWFQIFWMFNISLFYDSDVFLLSALVSNSNFFREILKKWKCEILKMIIVGVRVTRKNCFAILLNDLKIVMNVIKIVHNCIFTRSSTRFKYTQRSQRGMEPAE